MVDFQGQKVYNISVETFTKQKGMVLLEKINTRGKERTEFILQEFNVLWNNMHSRVRSGKGYEDVEICEEWYDFQNFIDTILEVPGIQDWIDYKMGFSKQKMVFDKDYLHYLETGEPKGKLYSPQTCCFIPEELNVQLLWISRQVQDGFRGKTTGPFIGYLKDEDGNIVDVVGFENLKEAKKQGWDIGCIIRCLKDRGKTHKCYEWEYVHGCRLPQQLELGDLTKEEYHQWRCMIDGEEFE